ncbi:MAG: hypothetical protein PVG41_16290 [Desulfobacteraceae bacterium]
MNHYLLEDILQAEASQNKVCLLKISGTGPATAQQYKNAERGVQLPYQKTAG